MGLRHRLDGLGRVLRGLDREDDVLSLAVHTHSVLLADSHVLGAIDHSDVVTSHQYAFRTFCLSVENMVILHPCFCFFMKALWFLTTFHTTSVDIYRNRHFLNGNHRKERQQRLHRLQRSLSNKPYLPITITNLSDKTVFGISHQVYLSEWSQLQRARFHFLLVTGDPNCFDSGRFLFG